MPPMCQALGLCDFIYSSKQSWKTVSPPPPTPTNLTDEGTEAQNGQVT